MFPRQNLAALIHALTVAAMPFSTVIGLVLFGMLTAPPSQQKSPETVSEIFSAAETKALQGKYKEALDLYNQIITKSPKSWALASAYWERGATYFNQFTRVNTKVRSLTANLDLLSYIHCKIEKQQKMIKYAKSIFS
jgi:tetratricopeptide (TPR) repeat protein